jgi:hypothetical protein
MVVFYPFIKDRWSSLLNWIPEMLLPIGTMKVITTEYNIAVCKPSPGVVYALDTLPEAFI